MMHPSIKFSLLSTHTSIRIVFFFLLFFAVRSADFERTRCIISVRKCHFSIYLYRQLTSYRDRREILFSIELKKISFRTKYGREVRMR